MPRLLVINPNTTASVTDLVVSHFRKAVGAGVDIVPATGRFGCAYISSEACYAVAAHAALECYAEHGQGCDGVLLACFGDPGLFALREVSPVPVTGLAEACMQSSAARVQRFSVVTGGYSWKPMLERFASGIGFTQALASVRTVSLSGGQVAADPDAALDMLASACRAAAVEDGAQEVILGGAGLAGLAERIQSRCPVPVLDSVRVGAQIAFQRLPGTTAALLDLEAVNGMECAAFTRYLGGVFENSPWVAERAWGERPFVSRLALHEAMVRAMHGATREEKLGLLRAHPELAGREARDGALTPDSITEQGRLGFIALSAAELERMARLNRSYREKFGFPAIVALALHRNRDTVLAEIERRIGGDVETEIAHALGQVAHITRARLEKLIREK